MPPRRPTDLEWQDLVGDLPNLTRADAWITDEPTHLYNCIAYSVGITDRWSNPPQPLNAFQALYNRHPYNHPTVGTDSPDATIDGWATPKNGPIIREMTHGSRRSTSEEAPLWESKLGSDFRITHGRGELLSDLYGRVVTSFSDGGVMAEGLYQEPELTKVEVESVRTRPAHVSPELRSSFQSLLAALRESWRSPEKRYLSDSGAYAAGPEFEALAALGLEALPLVLEEMIESPSGFLLLPVLELWTARDDLVSGSSREELESQQSRARRAVRELLA